MCFYKYKFLPIIFFTLLHINAIKAEATQPNENDSLYQELNQIHQTMSNLGWRSSFNDTDTKKIYERVEELLSALNQNTTELEDNAQAMRDKEQSTANKILGAASIAATGIGGMELASALAEKKADEEAERDMASYLATFRCDYGNGKSFKGGETEIQLPGGNALLSLYQEYVTLANDLKIRKQSLGLQPGIESELILDSAQLGLYDDVSNGKQNGAFVSVAAALTNPDDENSTKWNQQKSDTKKKLTTGAIAAGVGIVGGAIGNAVINKKSVKENSAEILARRDEITTELHQIIRNEIQKCNDLITEYQDRISNADLNPSDEDDKKFISDIKNMKPLDVNGNLSQLEDVVLCHQ